MTIGLSNLWVICDFDKSFFMWNIGMHKNLIRINLRDCGKRRIGDKSFKGFCFKEELRNGKVADKGIRLAKVFFNFCLFLRKEK